MKNSGRGNRRKLEEKKAPCPACPCTCTSDSLFQHGVHPSSDVHSIKRLEEVHPALPWPNSSLCLSCPCHLPLQTAVGMPRDASAYSTEHQVITTAPSCVVDSVRRLSHPLCRLACSGGRSGELEQLQGAVPRCNAASSQGGLSTSCSALAPEVRCGATALCPASP